MINIFKWLTHSLLLVYSSCLWSTYIKLLEDVSRHTKRKIMWWCRHYMWEPSGRETVSCNSIEWSAVFWVMYWPSSLSTALVDDDGFCSCLSETWVLLTLLISLHCTHIYDGNASYEWARATLLSNYLGSKGFHGQNYSLTLGESDIPWHGTFARSSAKNEQIKKFISKYGK